MIDRKCKIVPIVVTYNRLEKLRQVMERLFAFNFEHVVIVDNASTDGTGEYLASLAAEKPIHLISLRENTGGAGGFHAGVRYAHEHLDYDYLLLQDDDAWPGEGVMERLCSYEQRPDAVIAAVHYPDGRVCPMNIPGHHPFKDWRQTLRTLIRGARGFHVTEADYQSGRQQAVDFASFVGLFVHRRVIEQVGYPDDRWFIYGDDLEYTLRIRQAGFQMVFDPALHYVHDCQTLKEGKKIYQPLWKAYFTYRNNLHIAKQVAGWWYPLVVLYRVLSWHFALFRYPRE
ncbi:glycosyltransferase, partial [Candidatus Parcubacteria bacterium]